MKRLTRKQQEFAYKVAQGESLTGAYRSVYDAENSRPHTISVEASRLAQHPEVSRVVEVERERLIRCSQERGQAWRLLIDEKLWDLANREGVSDRDRIAALKLAGQQVHVNAWSQAQPSPEAGTDIQAALASLAAELAESGIVVDIDAVPVERIEQAKPDETA